MAKSDFTIRLPQKKGYERGEWLKAASRAVAKRRYRKAIQKYREILDVDPRDHEVHAKLAPLLAKAKRYDEAWSSYVAAAEAYVHRGFVDKAMSIYSQACKAFPHRAEVWRKLSDLKQERGLAADAVRVLLEGRRHNRRSKHRAQAVSLLNRALQLAPGNVAISLDLAKLLLKQGRRDKALQLLQAAARRARGGDLRRVRGLLFKLRPSPGNAWRWLRAVLGGG